jgi:hypothetical protein
MARLALLLIAVLAAPAAAAEPLTAEGAMAGYRKMIEPVEEVACPKARDPDEIIVCGRPGAKDPNRLPIPIQRMPGEIVHGEGVSPVAVASTRERCTTVGPNQNCGGGLPILGIAMTLVKVAVKAIQPRD